jgi:hypothetical protein
MVSDISAIARNSQPISNVPAVQRTAAKLPVESVEKVPQKATQQSNGKDSATFSREALERLQAEENKDCDCA